MDIEVAGDVLWRQSFRNSKIQESRSSGRKMAAEDGSLPIKRSRGRPRGRPTLDESKDIGSELLDGALREFLKTGYGGTSMTQIVRVLGISKTTLYSRYPSKADLFHAIILRQITKAAAATSLTIQGSTLQLGSGLRAYGNRTLEISLSGDLLEVNRLIYSESQRFPELGKAAIERTQTGIRQIAEFIAQAAERDGIPVRDPEGVASAFIFMLRGWYVSLMPTGEPVSTAMREAWVESAVHALISGRDEW
jgi:TetR/AcrR family transcriptional repressor of mexJK operon